MYRVFLLGTSLYIKRINNNMNKLLTCTCGDKWREEGHLFLRVVTGIAFLYHGYQKIFVMGIENVVPFFQSVGVPAAGVFAYLVAYGELLGGIALIVGFMTHWVSKIDILIILGAIGFVHISNGYGVQGGYEYPLLLLASSTYFFVTGAGRYSVDACIKR
jgi:putative oxidoreductase